MNPLSIENLIISITLAIFNGDGTTFTSFSDHGYFFLIGIIMRVINLYYLPVNEITVAFCIVTWTVICILYHSYVTLPEKSSIVSSFINLSNKCIIIYLFIYLYDHLLGRIKHTLLISAIALTLLICPFCSSNIKVFLLLPLGLLEFLA